MIQIMNLRPVKTQKLIKKDELTQLKSSAADSIINLVCWPLFVFLSNAFFLATFRNPSEFQVFGRKVKVLFDGSTYLYCKQRSRDCHVGLKTVKIRQQIEQLHSF